MSIEDRYLSGLIAVQYPEPTDPTSMDGVQLAAGPSNTVSDAGGGVRVGRAGVPYKPPSMSDITEPAGAMLDMGAATLKGATQGFIGLPGDLEGIGRLVLDKMGFGVDQNTVLPKTEEVKKWLDSNVGQVGNGQNPYESIGEVTAPGGQVKALKAAGRGAKALAPKAAEMVLDATEKTGVPVRGLGIVENAPQLVMERVPGVKPGDELIVQHNLTASNLLKADKLGGLPVPSLAISKVGAPLEGFGEITLIAPKEMATPSAKNPVFASDAYTKRFPTIDYQIDSKSQKTLKTLLSDVADKIPGGDYKVDRLLNDWNDRKYSDVLAAKFLDERGQLPNAADFDESWKFDSALREAVSKNQGEFTDWLEKFDNTLPDNGVNVKERIFKGFTYSGNRRYAEVNLTNLVKEMKGGANEEGWNYGVSSLRAAATPKFKKFSEIKDARDKIIDSKSMESVKDQTRQAYESLLDRLFKVNPQYDAGDAMLEVVQTRNINSLDREYDLPPELKADISVFIQKLKTLPTEYFEMKPQRAVNLDEFRGAIIPKDTPQAARDVLKKAGITDIHEYSTPEERKGLFDKFGKEMFAAMPAAPMGAATMQDKEKN